MSIALVIVLSYGIISVGGFDGVVAHVGDLKGFLSILQHMMVQLIQQRLTVFFQLPQHLLGDLDTSVCHIFF